MAAANRGAQDAGVIVDCRGDGCDEASVAHGAEIFCGIKAEGGGIAESAGGCSVPGGPEGLRGIFDE